MRDPHLSQYPVFAQILHWLVVALILGQWLLAETAEAVDGRVITLALLAIHKSTGMTVLLIASVRLIYHFFSRQPAFPQSMPVWQQRSADSLHAALYALIFALPLSGWLGSSASAYSVSWFNLFSFPDLIRPDETLKDFFFSVHEWSWRLLCVLVLIHIAAALKHHFFDKDAVLAQMSGRVSIVAGIITVSVIAAIAYSHIQKDIESGQIVEQNSKKTNLANQPALQNKHNTEPGPGSAIEAWPIDYANSYIQFTAEQAGASFNGRFTQWRTKILFDKDRIREGSIETQIELVSVDTEDQERDDTLASDDFFATPSFPVAIFRASHFELDAVTKKIKTRSTLDIKGKSFPIDFEFEVTDSSSRITLVGHAKLDRLQMKIGTGEWLDTTWIGQFVDVHVVVTSPFK